MSVTALVLSAMLAGKIRKTLIEQKELRSEEGLTVLRNIETGKPISAHGGSVYYNACRKRWVMIVLESFGTSPLGEIWYAEADTPPGPWVYARKIVTHDKYSFYNPGQHPFFDQQGGRIIFFEGTYTSMFSGNPEQTPRYNYNQIMYSLDLADERLALPVAIYETTAGDDGARYHPRRPGTTDPAQLERIAFFAPDRRAPGTIPVYEQTTDAGLSSLHFGEIERPENKRRLLFYALPAEMEDPPAATLPLYEYQHAESGFYRYSTNENLDLPGYRRSESPFCRVRENPVDVVVTAP